MLETKDDLNLSDLGAYHGTENYVNVFGVNVTDGIGYIMNNGYSWFVTDSIVILKTIKNQEFLSVKLQVDLENHKGKMIITDGNNKVLYTQNYDYTDAKRNLTLFFCNNVLMLSGEY